MITQEIINRINALAKKQREEVLSESEKVEQTQLRRLYIDNIKNQIKSYFDVEKPDTHSESCKCGCHEKQ